MTYYDIFPVNVNFLLTNSEEEKFIEAQMVKVSNDNEKLDELEFCIRKLNLNNTTSATYNKQVRTYFIDQYSPGRMQPLYRYDKNLQLTTAGRKVRRGIENYQHHIFETPQPYTPAPKFQEIQVKPKEAVYKIDIDKDENLLDSHPFKESQFKLTYGTLNDYTRAYQKNEKVAIRGRSLKFKLHGIDSKHDGTLVRVITEDTAHYFKCAKPGLGKSGHLSVFLPADDGSIKEVKRWSPKKHLPMLKELVLTL